MSAEKAWISWSSGKDSAWALFRARELGNVDVVGMLCTVTKVFGRVSMHGVREALLEAQAEAAGLPLHKVYIPFPCSDEEYRRLMGEAMGKAVGEGVSRVIFGDIFLEDVRRYREDNLREAGLKGLFPLWGEDPAGLAEDMIAGGVRAVVSCVDPRKVPKEWAGREWDGEFIAALPAGVDPCGENGEFHTFCFAGPMFGWDVAFRRGERVERDGFVFADFEPA